MFSSLLVLFFLPWLDRSKIKSCSFRPIYRWFTILFFIDFFILGYVGLKPAVGSYLLIARIGVIYYFSYFFILAPFTNKIENEKKLPESIYDSYIGKNKKLQQSSIKDEVVK